MLKRYLIILNPTAGKGAATGKLPLIHDFLNTKGIEYEIVYTEKVGHAAEIAAEHARDDDTAIIAAGGDGTCNEVINGLMKGKAETIPTFGVLPLGRGNDFSYGGHVPAVLDEALEIMIAGKTSPLDVGVITGGFYPEGRYFGNGIGAGFDTVVGLEAAKMKNVKDEFAYVFGTMKTLIKFSDSPEIEITYNGNTTSLRAIQISIMNGNRMGGLFYMAPEAVNNDGLLDLCMVAHKNRRQLIKTIIHYTKGTQKRLPGITIDRADSFTLKALKGGMVVHADGETICTEGKELEIKCIPSPIKIIHT
ncbi:MAG: YegS/Rv2252/BmrU family lipid kinase [Spirochaetales bacterium]|nr:YegS/Rv2252/BmrU family lipid kinase [Spirochaetales bacterium]